MLIKRQTKATLGIKRPNMHKLRTLGGGRARLGERRLISSSCVGWLYPLPLLVQHSPPVLPGDPLQSLSSHPSPIFSDMSDDGQSGGGGGGYKLEYGPNNRAACKGTYSPPI